MLERAGDKIKGNPALEDQLRAAAATAYSGMDINERYYEFAEVQDYRWIAYST